MQGTLVGPAEINDLDYSGDDGTSVQIDNIQFDWQPRRLIRRQLRVESFTASGIVVRLPAPAAGDDSISEEPFQLKDLKLPVAAEIKSLSLSDIQVFTDGSKEPVVIDSIELGGSARDSDLQLLELSASTPTAALRVDGVVNASGNWPMSVTAAWQYQHSQLGQLEAVSYTHLTLPTNREV